MNKEPLGDQVKGSGRGKSGIKVIVCNIEQEFNKLDKLKVYRNIVV